MYDKVSLVQNLVRAPVTSRLKRLPDSEGKQDPTAYKNVTKIINIPALQSGDFSLSQNNHVDWNWLQASEEFRWAGDPSPDDFVSESWHSKNYEVDVDPKKPFISEARITLKRQSAQITAQKDWEMFRNSNHLRVNVDGMWKSVDSDWLSNDLFAPSSPLSLLRDLLYAIEAFGAKKIYTFFLPAQDNWIEHEMFDGDLKSDIVLRYSRVSSPHEAVARGLRFLQAGRFGIISLSLSFIHFKILVRSSYPPMKVGSRTKCYSNPA